MEVVIAGDYCPIGRVAEIIKEGKYSPLLDDIRDITNKADYSIVNLECPVVMEDAHPIDKCGPNLKSDNKSIEALKWAGFDCVTLANNHFYDYGKVGVKNTLDACDEFKIDYVGGGMNIDEASITLYKDIAGKKLAIINCCEHEFSIATETSAGSNPLNIVKQYYAIKEACENADKVIVIVHGGVELFWLPSRRMIETYRFFVDAGADAIINHHQHCYSGYEVYKGTPIFYGLGNFCFDSITKDYRWTSGYMVCLGFNESEKIEFELIPYRQCDEQARVRLIEGEEKVSFFKNLIEYNDIIADDTKRENEYLLWCAQTEGMFRNTINPVYNRLTAWLFKSPLGKKIISKRKLLQTLNYVVNESHIERLRIAIERKIKTY